MDPTLPFQEICSTFHLGQVISLHSLPPIYLHSLWYLKTSTGDYALKEFNLDILGLLKIDQNELQKKQIIAKELNMRDIPTVVADFFFEKNNRLFMLFPWIKGENKQSLNENQAQLIGEYLACIHSADIKLELTSQPPEFFSPEYWKLCIANFPELDSFFPSLQDWSSQVTEKAFKELNYYRIISHRDLDQKNVLWVDDHPFFIDWDYAGWINPLLDLFIVSINWSLEEGKINKNIFEGILRGYCIKRRSVYNVLSTLDFVLPGYYGYVLEWISFNFQRIRKIPNSKLISYPGIIHSLKTLNVVTNNASELLKTLEKTFNKNS